MTKLADQIVSIGTSDQWSSGSRPSCWDFVEKVLDKAGAKTSNDWHNGAVPSNGPVTWGTVAGEGLGTPDVDLGSGKMKPSPIKGINDAQPGDIIQLTCVKWWDGRKRLQHTEGGVHNVIVMSNNAGMVEVVGASGKRGVQKETYNLSEGVLEQENCPFPSNVIIYRPVKKESPRAAGPGQTPTTSAVVDHAWLPDMSKNGRCQICGGPPHPYTH